MTTERVYVIAILALDNMLSTVTSSCIAPFFPMEASHKGMNTTQIGLAIGLYQLVIFLASPIIGKFVYQFSHFFDQFNIQMPLIRANRAFSGGLLLTALSTIGLAETIHLPNGYRFFVGVLLIRVLQGIGSACFSTGAWSIVGRLFPEKINFITVI